MKTPTTLLQSKLAKIRENFIALWNEKMKEGYFRQEEIIDYYNKEMKSLSTKLVESLGEIISEVEANWGITSSQNAPMLGDGKGQGKYIVFMDYKKWQEIKERSRLAELLKSIKEGKV
jgi:hypothetical protein